MTEDPKKLNIVDITVKRFQSHMVVADYKITLQSVTESVQELIDKIPDIQKKILE